jgi:hypothetical protein
VLSKTISSNMSIDDILFGLIVCGLALAVAYIRADLRQARGYSKRSSYTS